ncbi:ISAs1 family transposase [Rhodococcus marinonascens]|uniref:ISAs1 family transposase n=1 Tax=Rhodococcus marinonascens TaxID=38311 RepID=UPI000A04FA17|nr:ISAs1 family transposase [Rhodococcus marinonascens]
MPAGTVSPIDPCLHQLTRWGGVVTDTRMQDLLTVLDEVPDPRDRRGRRYRLPSLIAVALCAVAAGARSFYAIADWVAGAPREVLQRCGIRFRVPSEAAIRQVLGRIDGDTLDGVLVRYLAVDIGAEGGRTVVAVDGKTIRGARIGKQAAPHLVAAVTHGDAVVVGQCRTVDKSNEIPTVRKLLRGLDIAGAVVTVDAMHTQRATARCLREQCRAEYVMIVKANRPGLLARVRDQPWERVPVVWSDPVERGHGREEHRGYKILTIARGLRFPYAQQAIRITRRRRIGTDRWSIEVVYAICSLPCEQAPPKLLAAWIRGHWHIENKVHYVRDVTFDEDRSTIRAGHGPQVMATLRNVAVSLHRRAGHANIAQACRRLAANPYRVADLVLRG